ncbi:hypothetical protein V6N12_017130 [Hibiscus sabdariffa]|uniref:Uncharacterized protein n=1 Tax=Hibiscus sabdariffa TaxID=183260 RepID=A0ABR2BBU2_9ROSI
MACNWITDPTRSFELKASKIETTEFKKIKREKSDIRIKDEGEGEENGFSLVFETEVGLIWVASKEDGEEFGFRVRFKELMNIQKPIKMKPTLLNHRSRVRAVGMHHSRGQGRQTFGFPVMPRHGISLDVDMA